jgi:hypothetical protein
MVAVMVGLLEYFLNLSIIKAANLHQTTFESFSFYILSILIFKVSKIIPQEFVYVLYRMRYIKYTPLNAGNVSLNFI